MTVNVGQSIRAGLAVLTEPGPAGSAPAGLTGETLAGPSALTALAADWESLYRRSPAATPFLAHGWICSYAGAYLDPAELRVVCVRDPDGRLAAAAPLRLVRRRPGPSALIPVAAELSDFTDVLLDPTVDGADQALVAALLELPGWDVLDAPEVPPDAALRSVAARWPGQQLGRPASTCLELPVRPAGELVESLAGRYRKHNRRALRRIDSLQLRTTPVPAEPAAIAAAVAELLDLHARQWAGRPINPAHVTGRFRRHLTAAAQRLVPAGQAALLRSTVDGTVVAVSLTVLTDDLVGAYLHGVDPKLRAQVDLQALMLLHRLEVGLARGARRLSLLRGDEEAKRRWEPVERRNQRLVLLRPLSARAVLGAAAMLARGAVEDRVRRSPGATRTALRLRERWQSVTR